MRRCRRSLVAAFLAVGAVGPLSGCTAPVDGLIGITLNHAGQPSVVLISCRHQLGGATMYWVDDPAGSDSWHALVAQWKLPAGYSSPIQWPLLSSEASGVTIVKRPAALSAGRRYRVYGWTHSDPYYSADGPDFTADDVAQLGPGEILIPGYLLSPGSDSEAPARVGMDEFKRLACEQV